MNGSLRIWIIVSAAAVIAVLASGWFLGVQPQIASATTADQATSSMDGQNQATRLRLAELAKLAAKTGSLQVDDAKLMKAVPEILKPNTFIRRMNEVAALDGVTVQSVTPGDAAAYAAPRAGTAVAGSAPAPILAKTDPSVTAANFAVVPVSVVVSGTMESVLQFSHDIQNDERLFLITSVQTSEDDTGAVAGTFSGAIYTLQR